MSVIRVVVHDINGRHISCEDEAEHVGPWLIRALARTDADFRAAGCVAMMTIEYTKVSK